MVPLLALLFTIPGMSVPESVCLDPVRQHIYVSNIVGEGWASDGVAFISRLKWDGTVETLKWRTRTAAGPLNAPKGMCILGDWLYVADNEVVQCFSLTGPESKTVTLRGARGLNDLATDGKLIWATDTKAGRVLAFDPDNPLRTRRIPGVPVINGLTWHNGHLYCVSWENHEVYELDPLGQKPPQAFGLAAHFDTMDSIEVLPDGDFIVTSFMVNKVQRISADRKTVTLLAEVKSAADIGVDVKGGRLFVPQFYGDAVSVLALPR